MCAIAGTGQILRTPTKRETDESTINLVFLIENIDYYSIPQDETGGKDRSRKQAVTLDALGEL